MHADRPRHNPNSCSSKSVMSWCSVCEKVCAQRGRSRVGAALHTLLLVPLVPCPQVVDCGALLAAAPLRAEGAKLVGAEAFALHLLLEAQSLGQLPHAVHVLVVARKHELQLVFVRVGHTARSTHARKHHHLFEAKGGGILPILGRDVDFETAKEERKGRAEGTWRGSEGKKKKEGARSLSKTKSVGITTAKNKICVCLLAFLGCGPLGIG